MVVVGSPFLLLVLLLLCCVDGEEEVPLAFFEVVALAAAEDEVAFLLFLSSGLLEARLAPSLLSGAAFSSCFLWRPLPIFSGLREILKRRLNLGTLVLVLLPLLLSSLLLLLLPPAFEVALGD